MSIRGAIEDSVQAVTDALPKPIDGRWEALDEQELLFELAACQFSSQCHFELALAAAEALKSAGLLVPSALSREGACVDICRALERKLSFSVGGKARQAHVRFRERSSQMLARTGQRLYGSGGTISGLLKQNGVAKRARLALTQVVVGFGPKQASLFLRRIGFTSELAILDAHALDYLELCGITLARRRLATMTAYEEVESRLAGIAATYGFPVGQMDCAIWVTMRVAKREGFL